mgnify:CR=1 FL=1
MWLVAKDRSRWCNCTNSTMQLVAKDPFPSITLTTWIPQCKSRKGLIPSMPKHSNNCSTMQKVAKDPFQPCPRNTNYFHHANSPEGLIPTKPTQYKEYIQGKSSRRTHSYPVLTSHSIHCNNAHTSLAPIQHALSLAHNARYNQVQVVQRLKDEMWQLCLTTMMMQSHGDTSGEHSWVGMAPLTGPNQ